VLIQSLSERHCGAFEAFLPLLERTLFGTAQSLHERLKRLDVWFESADSGRRVGTSRSSPKIF
jgi:hypothetical protein